MVAAVSELFTYHFEVLNVLGGRATHDRGGQKCRNPGPCLPHILFPQSFESSLSVLPTAPRQLRRHTYKRWHRIVPFPAHLAWEAWLNLPLQMLLKPLERLHKRNLFGISLHVIPWVPPHRKTMGYPTVEVYLVPLLALYQDLFALMATLDRKNLVDFGSRDAQRAVDAP